MADNPKEKDYSQRYYDFKSKSYKLDVNNPEDGQSGREMYKILSETPDGFKVSQSYAENGLFRITNDGHMEISAGSKTEADKIDIRISCIRGGIAINADRGAILIKGKSVVFDIAGEFAVNAQSIQMGNNKTRKVNIEGFETNLSSEGGSLIGKNSLSLTNFFKKILGLIPGVGSLFG